MTDMDDCPICDEPIVDTHVLERAGGQLPSKLVSSSYSRRVCYDYSGVGITFFVHPQEYYVAESKKVGEPEYETIARSTQLEGVDIYVSQHFHPEGVEDERTRRVEIEP